MNKGIAIFAEFRKKMIDVHTAKAPALNALINICERDNPKKVLELGGGIGTLTYTVLKNSNATVDVYEQEEFCRVELEKNLSEFKGRYNVISSYRTLPPSRDYDLMIIDGGEAKDHDNGYEEVAWLFLTYLTSVKTIFIEGRRTGQREQVRRALRKKGYFKLIRHKDMKYKNLNALEKEHIKEFLESKRSYSDSELDKFSMHGGLEIIHYPMKFALIRWGNYLFWEFLINTNKILRKITG